MGLVRRRRRLPPARSPNQVRRLQVRRNQARRKQAHRKQAHRKQAHWEVPAVTRSTASWPPAIEVPETEVRQIMALLEDQRNYAEVSSAPVELARKYGLKVPSVTYQKEGVEEAFIRVTFVFSVTGPYEAIRKYISEIENAKALYVIEDMSLGKSSREGNHLELHMKMSALIKTAR